MATVVEYTREQGGTADRFVVGATSLPEFKMDFSGLSREEKDAEHAGARLLLCACMACYCNTFANALEKAGATVKSLTASGTTEKGKDDLRRTRYTRIILELEVAVDDAHAEIFDRVRDNMEAGSLLTYSLEDAIEMEYNVRRV